MSHRVSRVIDRLKELAHNRLVGGERHRKQSAPLGRTIEGRPQHAHAAGPGDIADRWGPRETQLEGKP